MNTNEKLKEVLSATHSPAHGQVRDIQIVAVNVHGVVVCYTHTYTNLSKAKNPEYRCAFVAHSGQCKWNMIAA